MGVNFSPFEIGRRALRAVDAAVQLLAIRREWRYARCLRGAASPGKCLGKRTPRHQDPFAAIADLDRLAIVHDSAHQGRLAHGASATGLACEPHAIRRRLGTHERAAVPALPAGPAGKERHWRTAVGAVHSVRSSQFAVGSSLFAVRCSLLVPGVGVEPTRTF